MFIQVTKITANCCLEIAKKIYEMVNLWPQTTRARTHTNTTFELFDKTNTEDYILLIIAFSIFKPASRLNIANNYQL